MLTSGDDQERSTTRRGSDASVTQPWNRVKERSDTVMSCHPSKILSPVNHSFDMPLFVAQMLILLSMSLANITSNSLARRSLAAHSSNALKKRGISTVEEEAKWLSENPGFVKKLSCYPQSTIEAYAVLESLKDRTEGRPFSEASWNDIDSIDNKLLETIEDGDYKLSGDFESARDAAFYNLDVAIRLIRIDKYQKAIDVVKHSITKQQIEVVALDTLRINKRVILHLLKLQRTPRTKKEASDLLKGIHPFILDTPMKAMLEKARKNLKDKVDGPWLLVILACMNYMKARVLLDGSELELWLRQSF
jgi:hypothetical protein